MDRLLFCGNTPDGLSAYMEGIGFGSEHALKTTTDFYRKKIFDFRLMTDIPLRLRSRLEADFTGGIIPHVDSQVSSDKSVKYIFNTGLNGIYESVYLPDRKRSTVCVSSQSGCRMGCPFCLTGKMGFNRNLKAGEMISQVLSVPDPGKVTHVVFMGMGEPLDNLGEVIEACRILTASWGLALSPKRITVSTVGITEKIREFLEMSDCNLTLSLYSPFTSERVSVIPTEKKNSATGIIDLMKEYSHKGKRRMSIAYMMINNVNDTEEHLEEIVRLLKGTGIRVNLLPYHRIINDPYETSPVKRMEHFKHSLVISGISASIRRSRGNDISAACGLLASGLNSKTDSNSKG